MRRVPKYSGLHLNIGPIGPISPMGPMTETFAASDVQAPGFGIRNPPKYARGGTRTHTPYGTGF